MSITRVTTVLLSVLAGAAGLGAQQDGAVPIYQDLGELHREITTSSDAAQRYFDQGLLLGYSFGRSESARSFRAAREADPSCAMCWWGEAWALGPYQNGRMSVESGREAYTAIRRALDELDDETPLERALVEAMATRYSADPESENRAALDSAYVRAMRDVVRRFPHDLDAGTLLGESLTLLSPWDLWTPAGDPKPGTEEAVAVLESVLGRDLKHAGACHLYIHTVEASGDPGRAAACADHLAAQAPGASHMQHMPSHIYAQIGRFGDAVRANQKAWMVDQQAVHGGTLAIYPPHNVEMLAFVASYDGQGAIALDAAAAAARLRPTGMIYRYQTLARFGRWDELVDLDVEHELPLVHGYGLFSRGLARLRQGRVDEARADLERLARIRATLSQDGETATSDSPVHDLLGVAEHMLSGETAAQRRRWDVATDAFREAIALFDALPYDEPETWILPPHHFLGATLLEAGRPAEAERIYRAELEQHPGNGWSLLGLAMALEDQGRDREAREARRAFRDAWTRADVWIGASRL